MKWMATALLSLCMMQAHALVLAGQPVLAELKTNMNETLVLRGAAIRTKYFFDVYIGALYTRAQQTISLPVNSSQPQKMWFKILYKHISAEQFREGWQLGLEDNVKAGTLIIHQAEIAKFLNAISLALNAGDELVIEYAPKRGTLLTINQGQTQVFTKELYNLLLATWIGDHPPSSDFKRALLP